MRKLATLLFLLILALGISTIPMQAASGEFDGVWHLYRDFTLDGTVTGSTSGDLECNSHHNKFVCHPVASSDNDSIFEGETNQERTTKIITFMQYDATYYVTHSGREVSEKSFEGTWYDVAGNAGDFRLEK